MTLAFVRADEAAALARLHEDAFPVPWTVSEFAALLDSPGVVAQAVWSEGAAIALILIRVVADEAEVITIAVAEGHRRQRLATVLLDAAKGIARARGAARMLLEVAQSNGPARALYLKAGFTALARRRDYYGPETDALVLCLDLNR